MEVNAILALFSGSKERTSKKGSDLPTLFTFSVILRTSDWVNGISTTGEKQKLSTLHMYHLKTNQGLATKLILEHSYYSINKIRKTQK